jgi:cyclophilin family peptidyl-prolyl cis-trans isomerase
MRPAGFEPATHGLEGRRSSTELQALGKRVQSAPGVYGGAMSEAILETNHGRVRLELFGDDAPKTVESFETLAGKGFYDGLTFHRVIEDFMVQAGCPRGDGTGGPGYTFEDEPNEHRVERGALAMANAGPDTNGSQFFIVTAGACPWLDGKHTVFGRVIEGMDVIDAISRVEKDARDRPLDPVVIERVALSPEALPDGSQRGGSGD